MSALTLEAVASKFAEQFAASAPQRVDFRGETTFTLALVETKPALKWCRDELGFDYLLDICSVDNFGEDPRFELVYELYSLTTHLHLRIKCRVSEDDSEKIPTVSDLWPTADWHEREIYDMMGLKFLGHPDLRRILMWEGYPVFPAAEGFSARRQGQRNAGRRFHRRRAAGGRSVCNVADGRDRGSPRAAREGLRGSGVIKVDRLVPQPKAIPPRAAAHSGGSAGRTADVEGAWQPAGAGCVSFDIGWGPADPPADLR